MNVLKLEQDFEPMDLIYENNAVFYPAGAQTYVYIVTPPCDVIAVNDTDVWINLSSEWLRSIIRDIDVQYLQYRSKDMTEYLKLISSLVPSVKLSPASTYTILKVHKRRYTELYNVDELSVGCSVQCVLSANYAKNNIIWNAVKIKTQVRAQPQKTKNEDTVGFLQECQLNGGDQTLIRIG